MFIYNRFYPHLYSFLMFLLEHLDILICLVWHVARRVIKELTELLDKDYKKKWLTFQMRKQLKQKARQKK